MRVLGAVLRGHNRKRHNNKIVCVWMRFCGSTRLVTSVFHIIVDLRLFFMYTMKTPPAFLLADHPKHEQLAITFNNSAL